jgi:hypothetical protein
MHEGGSLHGARPRLAAIEITGVVALLCASCGGATAGTQDGPGGDGHGVAPSGSQPDAGDADASTSGTMPGTSDRRGASGGTDAGGTGSAGDDGPDGLSSPLDIEPICAGNWPTTADGVGGAGLRGDNASLAFDAQGNLYLATSFTGMFGTLASTPSSEIDIIVLKLDAQCNVIWSRRFQGPGSLMWVQALAVDASGDLFLSGGVQTEGSSLFNWVDLGTGQFQAPNIGAFVTKLDPTGKTLWVDTYLPPGNSGGAAFVIDLAVDASGDAVFVLTGSVLAAPLPPDAGMAGDFGEAVKLDPGGRVVFTAPWGTFASDGSTLQSLDVAPDRSIWASGVNPGTGDIHLVHLGPDGTTLTSQAIPTPATPGLYMGAAVRVGPTGDAVLSWGSGPGTGSDWTRWLEGLSPTGAVLWTYPALLVTGEVDDPAQLARVDGDGDVWAADAFLGTQAFGGPVGTLTSNVEGSPELFALGRNGRLRGGIVVPGVTNPIVADIALGPNRTVALVGGQVNDPGMPSLFVSKFGY